MSIAAYCQEGLYAGQWKFAGRDAGGVPGSDACHILRDRDELLPVVLPVSRLLTGAAFLSIDTMRQLVSPGF